MAASRKRLSNNPVAQCVADSLSRHVAPHARLVLGLSGGLDSVVLLHALLALRSQSPFELRAVHVHHGLSIRADEWAGFCEQLCASHAIECVMHAVRVERGDPLGTEAAARRERQRVFASLDADYVLTAHHQDDQAETLLLQLLRGAGPKGLAAMAECSALPGGHAVHLRPLLGVTRAQIQAYAESHGLAWVDDESNLEVRYRRNALRHQVLPMLAEHFPGVGATLARAAALQAEAAELLADMAWIDAEAVIEGDRLDCDGLSRLSTARARNLLRHFIEQQGQPMPNERRLSQAMRQLLDAHAGAQVCVSIGAAEIRRYQGGAYVVPMRIGLPEPVRWEGQSELVLPGLGALSLRPVVGQGLQRRRLEAGGVTLGTRAGGEHLRLSPRGATRSLKNLLQEQAVKPWLRDTLPVLKCDGVAVWAAGLGCHADWLAGADEPGLVPEWRSLNP